MHWTRCAWTRSARFRWMPSSRRTPATRGRRWRSRRSPTSSTRGSCATRPSSRTGPGATASCCPAGTRRCCSTRRCYLAGYDVTLEQIKRFRQLDSPCAGHPEYGHVPGVETTTGPLGQGIATAVGMALGERMLAARFNRGEHTPIDSHTLLHRLRRRHGGGDRVGGLLDRRPPRARQADRLLRRQPHLDRGRHRAGVLRGRRRALRGLRLARPEPLRGPRARPAGGGDRQPPSGSPTARA